MAGRIQINMVPYKGEYELDLEGQPLSQLEWRWVKKISGYMPLTIGEGLNGGDPDLFCAFAVVALYRAGKITKEAVPQAVELFDDTAVDGATISWVDEETDARPPDLASDGVSRNGLSGATTRLSSAGSPATSLTSTGAPS